MKNWILAEESDGLTLGIQFLFKLGEHLQGEGLAFLPDINEFSDLFLQGKFG
jgi:hypothetical protein